MGKRRRMTVQAGFFGQDQRPRTTGPEVSLGALAALLFVAGTARADVTAVDMQEHLFGVSNVNAVAGHGGLTVGISVDGDLSLLSWPNPTFADQLHYLA